MWLQLASGQIEDVQRYHVWLEGHTKTDGTMPHDSVKAASERAVSHSSGLHYDFLILGVSYLTISNISLS